MTRLFCLLALCLGLALAAWADGVTITKGEDGGFTVATVNYTLKVGADGNWHSLVSGGNEFLLDNDRGLVGAGYLTITEASDGWKASAFKFAAITQTDAETLTATAEKRSVSYKFSPDGIELRFTQGIDPYIWYYTLNPALKDMLEKQSGEVIPFKTAYREGTPQLFAANGANVTFPPAAAYYIAKNARVKADTDPMLAQVWMPRTSQVPKEAWVQRLTIHAKATPADALQATIAVPTANHIFPGGGPAVFGLDGKLRIPGVAIDAQTELVVTDYLSKKEVFRKTLPLKLAELSAGKAEFAVTTPPGMYLATLTAKQGNDVLAVRNFPFAYDIEKMVLPAAPADFDKFWNDTLAEQEKIPADVQLELVKEENGCKLYKMTFTGLFNRKFHAWLSVPVKEGKYPAHLQLPPSGINATYLPYSGPVVGMSLAIAGQEVESPTLNYKPDPYFKRGWDYFQTGIEAKETWYYRAVFAACSRAVDILAARPEVDDARIFVTGGSQGGGLTFITAALNPKVDVAVSGSPGLFGLEWKLRYLPPNFWPPINPIDADNQLITDPKALEDRIAVARYCDAANFAPRITCALLLNLGMQDIVTSQVATLATWSRIRNAKVKAMLCDPWGGHNGPRGGQALSSSWWVSGCISGNIDNALVTTETNGLPVIIEKKK